MNARSRFLKTQFICQKTPLALRDRKAYWNTKNTSLIFWLIAVLSICGYFALSSSKHITYNHGNSLNAG